MESDGVLRVGERYEKDGKMWDRGTHLMTNGSELKYDKDIC